MFFVSHHQNFKESAIKERLRNEPMIAILLAAANFEWTCGRCIMFLSKSPNILLREKLCKTYGLDKYKDLWKEEIIKFDPSVIPLAQIIRNWNDFKEAFNLRHKLIHGRGTCSKNMASKHIDAMLAAVDDLYIFTNSRNVNLHNRLPIRRCKS